MSDTMAIERAAWIVAKVQNAISDDRRSYHDAIAWVSFITGYPRAYVAECWRNRGAAS